MNALRPQSANLLRPVGPIAAAGVCLALAACVGNPFGEARVDPQSAVAADVARITRAKARYPKFRDIPALPGDLRPVALYGREADELEHARAQILAATAPETWTLKDSQSFAAEARRRVGPDLPPAQTATPEAVARDLRERATPPPRR